MFRFMHHLYHSAPHPHWAYARRPSRLVWFFIGSGVTALIMKSHARAEFYRETGERGWGRCRRVNVEGMDPTRDAPANHNMDPHAHLDRAPSDPTMFRRAGWYPMHHPSSAPPPPPAPAVRDSPPPPPPSPSLSVKNTYDGWENEQDERIAAEKAHVAKVSRQAVDTMVELTEATLESVLTTAEALKVKLAEHRAERERQQKLIDQQLEAHRRDPPRLV